MNTGINTPINLHRSTEEIDDPSSPAKTVEANGQTIHLDAFLHGAIRQLNTDFTAALGRHLEGTAHLSFSHPDAASEAFRQRLDGMRIQFRRSLLSQARVMRVIHSSTHPDQQAAIVIRAINPLGPRPEGVNPDEYNGMHSQAVVRQRGRHALSRAAII